VGGLARGAEDAGEVEPSYEEASVARVIAQPGVPLLLTPASLLPDEDVAR
jgi:hypothetical protein